MLLKLWVVFLAALGTGERIHLQSLIDDSHQVQVGAGEADVMAILGEPDEQWDARPGWLFARPRLWLYRTMIEPGNVIVPGLPIANPLPISLRLFSPSESDLVIQWSKENEVTQIDRPVFGMPKDARELLAPVYFVRDIATVIGQFD